MKHINSFDKFNLIKEEVDNFVGFSLNDLYDLGAETITDAANLLAEEGTDEWDEIASGDPSDVIDKLQEFGGEEAISIINTIQDIDKRIAELQEMSDGDDSDDFDKDEDY